MDLHTNERLESLSAGITGKGTFLAVYRKVSSEFPWSVEHFRTNWTTVLALFQFLSFVIVNSKMGIKIGPPLEEFGAKVTTYRGYGKLIRMNVVHVPFQLGRQQISFRTTFTLLQRPRFGMASGMKGKLGLQLETFGTKFTLEFRIGPILDGAGFLFHVVMDTTEAMPLQTVPSTE